MRLLAQGRNPYSRWWLWIPARSLRSPPGMTVQFITARPAVLTPAPAPSASPASAELAARRAWPRQPRVQRLAEWFAQHRPASPALRPIAAPAREPAWLPAVVHRRAAEMLLASAPMACGSRHAGRMRAAAAAL